jgi:uncharacterized protein DUF4170
MAQRLHLLFGGELVDFQRTEFRNVAEIGVVGIFPDCASARAAWKGRAQATNDNAQVRGFITHLHRLVDEERATGPAEKIA